ncbi:hypothetical protein [Glutamicibacter ardleyensis]|uniref:hypothetical protein n=1 Tax=Glutamicibacter ardleyensis TaxID=225894 RepID=UPI003FD50D89
MSEKNEFEFGIFFLDEHGEVRSDWGWTRIPTLDSDGWFQLSQRNWVEVVKIMRRPTTVETVVWSAPGTTV